MSTATKALGQAAAQYVEARLEQGVKDLTERLESGLPSVRPHLPKPHLPKPRLPKASSSRSPWERIRRSSTTQSGGTPVTIVENLVIGVPVDVAYDHWVRFRDTPQWSRGVQEVEELDQDTTRWRARLLWAKREWKATTVEEVPEQRLAWRSESEDTRLRGVVTFHPLAEDATLLVLVLEYHPKGVLEHLGNLVRAQGRRVRLDLKRFQAFVTWQDGSEADSAPAPGGSADSDEESGPEPPGSEAARADQSEEDEG